MRFEGKTYWIVGASDGTGAALARELAAEGARLVLSARREDALAAVRDDLPGEGHTIVACDVSDRGSVNAAKARAGPIDGMVYVAAAYEPATAQTARIDVVETILDVNVAGLYRTLDAALPEMTARNAGHIVVFGSLSGYRGLPGAWPYGATKAACMSIAESLAADLRKTKIKVQCVNPGFIKTRLTEKNDFKMPFILTPEQAARRIRLGMGQNRFAITFPVRFALLFWLMRAMPVGLYTRMLRWFG